MLSTSKRSPRKKLQEASGQIEGLGAWKAAGRTERSFVVCFASLMQMKRVSTAAEPRLRVDSSAACRGQRSQGRCWVAARV